MNCRILLEPTVKLLKRAYYRMYFETIRQSAPLTLPAMSSGKFAITLHGRILIFFRNFLIVFSLYSENGVSITKAVYGIRSQANVAVLG